jgi:hypothetical protein
MNRTVAVLLLAVSTVPVMAAVPVEVTGTSDDAVGKRLVFYFKEGIRASQSFQLSLGNQLGLQVKIVTLDPSTNNAGYSTIYSAVWTWNNPSNPFPLYLTSSVGTCGSSRVKECAESLLVTTNDQLEDIARLVKAITSE